MDKKAEELAWKAFEKSGDAGTYLLYRALTKNAEEEKQ